MVSRPAITLFTAGLLAGCAAKVLTPSEQVDALFAPYTQGVRPDAAVMVMRGGEVVHAKGYGYADLANQVPIDPGSVFRLGSVSKQFAAMAIAILGDRGLLDYDDPVEQHVEALE